MAALLEDTRPVPPATANQTASDSPAVTAGLAYASRCLRGHRPFGVVTGSPGTLTGLCDRIEAECRAREDLHIIRPGQPTDSVQEFLHACLAQLGFELFDAGLDDFHNLLVVFLRHESARGRRTIAIIEDTQHYGPRVLEFMHTISKVRAGATPSMTFLLAGSQDLNRVLDSRGMAALRTFTRERFDLDRAVAWVAGPGGTRSKLERLDARSLPPASAPVVADPPRRTLTVMLDGTTVERRVLAGGRFIIGRSPNCTLRLDSRYVSRHHAALLVADDGVTVVDLRSRNGTLVNGEPAGSRTLNDGDLLGIGNFRIRYSVLAGTTPPGA